MEKESGVPFLEPFVWRGSPSHAWVSRALPMHGAGDLLQNSAALISKAHPDHGPCSLIFAQTIGLLSSLLFAFPVLPSQPCLLPTLAGLRLSWESEMKTHTGAQSFPQSRVGPGPAQEAGSQRARESCLSASSADLQADSQNLGSIFVGKVADTTENPASLVTE